MAESPHRTRASRICSDSAISWIHVAVRSCTAGLRPTTGRMYSFLSHGSHSGSMGSVCRTAMATTSRSHWCVLAQYACRAISAFADQDTAAFVLLDTWPCRPGTRPGRQLYNPRPDVPCRQAGLDCCIPLLDRLGGHCVESFG